MFEREAREFQSIHFYLQITNKFLLEQTQVLHSLRETVRVMAIIEPYIPNRIEASFLSVRLMSSHVLDELDASLMLGD